MEHNQDVENELMRLRGASDDRLRAYDRERGARRIQWCQTQRSTATAGDPLERAYRLLLQKLEIKEDQAPVVRKDETTIVFHSRNFCPTLAACTILQLDTRRVCRLYNEKSIDALVKQVDPRLAFSRNYEIIRPYSEYCEESISMK